MKSKKTGNVKNKREDMGIKGKWEMEGEIGERRVEELMNKCRSEA